MSKAGTWLKAQSPKLHRILTRRDQPFPILREILVAVLAILLLVGLLYGLTGQPFSGGYPVVVVTSGSMMHCTNADHQGLGSECDTDTFAGLGRIDPGDLVFVRHVSDPDDVATRLDPDASTRYGERGDVVVYRPHKERQDLRATPIIHRALFWVQIDQNGGATAIFGDASLPFSDPNVRSMMGDCTIADHRLRNMRPEDSGFVTRGDNNGQADQCYNPGFDYDLVTMPMVLGKARGELPWIGLVKLFVDDVSQGSSNFNNASGTAKMMLTVSVVVLIAAPWTVDLVMRRRKGKGGAKAEEKESKDE